MLSLCIICDKEFSAERKADELYNHAEDEHGLTREDYDKVDNYVLDGEDEGKEQKVPKPTIVTAEQPPFLICIVCESEFEKGDEERFWSHVSGEHGLSKKEYERIDNLIDEDNVQANSEKGDTNYHRDLSLGDNTEEVPLVMEVENGLEADISILRPPSETRHGVSLLDPEKKGTNLKIRSVSILRRKENSGQSARTVVDGATTKAPSTSGGSLNPVKGNIEISNPRRTILGTASLCTFQCDQCDFSASIWNNMRVHLGEHSKNAEFGSFKPRVLDPIDFVAEAIFYSCKICDKKLLHDQGILAQHIFYSHDISIYDYRKQYGLDSATTKAPAKVKNKGYLGSLVKNNENVEREADATRKQEKRAYGYCENREPKITLKNADKVIEEASTTVNKAQEQLALLREDDEYANGELRDSCEYVCPLKFGAQCRKKFFSADSLFIHVRGDHKVIAQESYFVIFYCIQGISSGHTPEFGRHGI